MPRIKWRRLKDGAPCRHLISAGVSIPAQQGHARRNEECPVNQIEAPQHCTGALCIEHFSNMAFSAALVLTLSWPCPGLVLALSWLCPGREPPQPSRRCVVVPALACRACRKPAPITEITDSADRCRLMHAARPGLDQHRWPQGPRLTFTMPGDFPLCRGRLTVSADVSALGQCGARLLDLIDVGRNRVMARPWRMRRQTKHRANRCERAAVDRRGAELAKR
jgi:hypothetical protein